MHKKSEKIDIDFNEALRRIAISKKQKHTSQQKLVGKDVDVVENKKRANNVRPK